MTEQQPIEWLIQNDPDANYLLNYKPKHTLKDDGTKLMTSFYDYFYNSECYLKFIKTLNRLSYWDEQTKIKRMAYAFKKLIMLSIFFDSLVDKNFETVHIKDYQDVVLTSCCICPDRIWGDSEDVFILKCNGKKGTPDENLWRSFGFKFVDRDDLLDEAKSFSDIKFNVSCWSSNWYIWQDSNFHIKNVSLNQIKPKDLGLEK